MDKYGGEITLEFCTDNLASALKAEKAGADRIELCADLEKDGLTPDQLVTEKVCAELHIPVKVMIRSRPGNFNYSDDEVNFMTDTIKLYRSFNVGGFVVGALTSKGLPDLEAIESWADAAGDIPLCFHKAIDLTNDWKTSLNMLSGIPQVKAILTSGLQSKARGGIKVLGEMVENYGTRFEIIAAGSITYNDIPFFMKKWSGRSLHGRRIVKVLSS